MVIVFRQKPIIPQNISSDYRKVLSLHSDPLSAIFIFSNSFDDKESTSP
nr:MAG TPA: hypothetical protein [Caudoviricetes sp.]